MKAKFTSIACATLLAGCMGTQTAKLAYESCAYPNSPESQAPQWVCDMPVKGVEVQAYGFAKKMAAGPGFMKDVATSEARSRLAQAFATDVKTKLERLSKDQDSNGEVTTLDVSERVYKVAAAMTLTNSRIIQSNSSPTGGLYVLVGLSADAYAANLKQLFETGVDTDNPELYLKFLMEEANAETSATAEKLKQVL